MADCYPERLTIKKPISSTSTQLPPLHASTPLSNRANEGKFDFSPLDSTEAV